MIEIKKLNALLYRTENNIEFYLDNNRRNNRITKRQDLKSIDVEEN